MVKGMKRNSSFFDVKMNVDLYVKVKAQAGSDAEYTVSKILIDALIKSGIVYKIDPRSYTTTPIIDIPMEGVG